MTRVARPVAVLLAVLLGVTKSASAQHYQSDFPPEEWKARWAAVFDKIGNEAVAVVQGVALTNGYQLPRQTNNVSNRRGVAAADDKRRPKRSMPSSAVRFVSR